MFKGILFLMAIQVFNAAGLERPLVNPRPDDVSRPFTLREADTYVRTLALVVPVLNDREKTMTAFSSSGIEPKRFHAIARRFDVALALLNKKIDWAEVSAWPPERRPTLMEMAAVAILAEPFNQVENEINRKVYFPHKQN